MSLAQITIELPQAGDVPSIQELVHNSPLVVVLLGLMALDIFTGILAAYIAKKLCSSASYRGMLKKVLILAVVAAAMLFERIVPNMPWGQIVAFFFVVTESISIVENASNAGVPIPKQFRDALLKAKAEEEKKQQAPPAVQMDVHAQNVHIKESGERERFPGNAPPS